MELCLFSYYFLRLSSSIDVNGDATLVCVCVVFKNRLLNISKTFCVVFERKKPRELMIIKRESVKIYT